MTIARTVGALLGTTDETGGTALAAMTTVAGAETDLLGDDTSKGEIVLFISFTVSAGLVPPNGELVISYQDVRIAGQLYQDPRKSFRVGLATLSAGTYRFYLGRFDVVRRGKVSALNSSNVALAGVAVTYSLEKLT